MVSIFKPKNQNNLSLIQSVSNLKHNSRENQDKLILFSGDIISGYKIVEELGVVAGSSVQARSFFHDLWCMYNALLILVNITIQLMPNFTTKANQLQTNLSIIL